MSAVTLLQHARVRLALHTLREAATDAPRLLVLHGLGDRTPDTVPAWIESWPGAIHGLDFTGHGASDVPAGGGYTCEQLMADVDTALAHLGPCTLYGMGLGGYVALLTAGARPQLVRGAIVDDGVGLAGGGQRSGSGHLDIANPGAVASGTPDPYALLELSGDMRPGGYAANFVRMAVQVSPLDTPISVVAVARPSWLQAVRDEVGVQDGTLAEALELYATADWPTT